MGKIGDIEELILAKLEAKYWDFPRIPDTQIIDSYDANDNPLLIKYYRGSSLLFSHSFTYDDSGRLIKKQLILP